MPLQKEFEFPSDEELNVPEVNISQSFLRAGALHLGTYCEKENNEFMLCRQENFDPRKCLSEGREVTNCTMKFFCNVKKHCCQEFDQFAKCLNQSPNMAYSYCRNTEAVFNKCMLDKMGLKKSPFGWHAEVHVHHTDRPKPKKEIAHYPDAPDKLPSDIKLEDPKFGFNYGL